MQQLSTLQGGELLHVENMLPGGKRLAVFSLS
jgi:hypothetical protein